MKTLEQLKEENAKEEIVEVAAPQAEAETKEIEADLTEEEDTTAELAGETEEETKEVELEAWQLEESVDDVKFTGSDIAAAKRNLRAKLEKRHETEVDDLKAKITELESKPVQHLQRPKLEDFDHDEEAYNAALDKYYDAKIDTKVSTANQTATTVQQQAQRRQALETKVNDHYERAARLTSETGINTEIYQQADLAVRQMVENVLPNRGDSTVDELISRLGEGSEKVMYYVGRNPTALAELQTRLTNDPSGLNAAIYLGKLSSEKTTQTKIKAKALKPATEIKGDESSNDVVRSLKRKYQNADKEGNVQARFNARKEARALGADVSNW